MRQRKKLTLFLTILFAVNIVIIAFAQAFIAGASYRKGDSGDIVAQIQQNLYDWGYYSGSVDGIFGSATEEAVEYFQRTNGLVADGIVGSKTLAALGIQDNSTSSGSSSYDSDVALLARLISAEARGEPYSGQVAVGAVVLNRVEHPSFPNTIAGVIYQDGAFSCLYDGQFNEPVADSAYRAAQDALNGWDPSGGAIYYFNPETATNAWIWSRPLITVIGNHRFCS